MSKRRFRSASRTPKSALAAGALMATVAIGVPVALPAADATTVDTSSQEAFIESVAPMAQQGQAEYGVPASVTIAQAILESDWGRSGLTTKGNAYFGIKCSDSNFATGCTTMNTREVFDGQPTYIDDGFRTYDDADASFRDHGDFLRNNSRYAKAFDFPEDPDQFIREVHAGGYATDPEYANLVIDLMRRYDLYRFDGGSAEAPQPAPQVPLPAPDRPRFSPEESAVEGEGPDAGAPDAPAPDAPAPDAPAPEAPAPEAPEPQAPAPAAPPEPAQVAPLPDEPVDHPHDNGEWPGEEGTDWPGDPDSATQARPTLQPAPPR